ncbi:MAG: hypothetical protein QW171_01235 [Candidatus Bilamarchaeaceae archaeon]
MRAFVFSLDAFVGFILALIAIYSLIFFSSVPSAYYYLLTQAHYLSRDTLFALSTANCYTVTSGMCTGSVLDYILSKELSTRDAVRKSVISDTVGKIVPTQFGYTFEVSSDGGRSWTTYYDTRSPTLRIGGDGHAKEMKKLKVATELVNFGYKAPAQKAIASPYKYLTCNGKGIEEKSEGIVITCGDYNLHNPAEGVEGSDSVIPTPEVKIVRLTIFI